MRQRLVAVVVVVVELPDMAEREEREERATSSVAVVETPWSPAAPAFGVTAGNQVVRSRALAEEGEDLYVPAETVRLAPAERPQQA